MQKTRACLRGVEGRPGPGPSVGGVRQSPEELTLELPRKFREVRYFLVITVSGYKEKAPAYHRGLSPSAG